MDDNTVDIKKRQIHRLTFCLFVAGGVHHLTSCNRKSGETIIWIRPGPSPAATVARCINEPLTGQQARQAGKQATAAA